MSQHDDEFLLILNHTVNIKRRSTFETTPMGLRRPTGEVTVVANASVFFQENTGKWNQKMQGTFKDADYIMMAGLSLDVQEGDFIQPVTVITGLTLGIVDSVEPIMDFDGLTHHIEVNVNRAG